MERVGQEARERGKEAKVGKGGQEAIEKGWGWYLLSKAHAPGRHTARCAAVKCMRKCLVCAFLGEQAHVRTHA